MAAEMIVEEETGTFAGQVHSHNGYYAGDFAMTTSTDWGHA